MTLTNFMKITQYRNDGKTQTQRILEFETAVDAMRTEVSSRPVSNLRNVLQYAMAGLAEPPQQENFQLFVAHSSEVRS